MNNKRILVTALVALIALIFSGCSNKSSSTDYKKAMISETATNEADYGYASAPTKSSRSETVAMDSATQYAEAEAIETDAPPEVEQKLIKNGSSTLDTNTFDETIANIRKAVADYGGYMESSFTNSVSDNPNKYSSNERHFSATIKVPAEYFDELQAFVGQLGRIISSSSGTENVTLSYYDMQSRLETKRIKEERILDLIELATNVDELLQLENMLTQIRTDINIYETRLKQMDRAIAYSTLRVSVNEVSPVLVIDSDDFIYKLQSGLLKSVEITAGFFGRIILFLSSYGLPLILIFAVIQLAYLVIKRKLAKP